jgi:hypothetical protein
MPLGAAHALGCPSPAAAIRAPPPFLSPPSRHPSLHYYFLSFLFAAINPDLTPNLLVQRATSPDRHHIPAPPPSAPPPPATSGELCASCCCKMGLLHHPLPCGALGRLPLHRERWCCRAAATAGAPWRAELMSCRATGGGIQPKW